MVCVTVGVTPERPLKPDFPFHCYRDAVIGALALLAHEPPRPVANLSLLTIFTLWTWTGYWGGHRPLKKRGFLSRR